MRCRRAAGLLLLGAAVAACGSSPGAPGPSPATFAAPTTVSYCTDGGVALTLDIFEPPGGGTAHPLLIVIHGGSWTFGSSRMGSQGALTQSAALLALGQGFAVASVNYRLAPRYRWPAQIIDVRCAVRYLRESASRWQLDPHRFVVLGNSAGGQLASLLALSDGQVPQWDNGEHAAQPTSVAAVVDLWGPEDLIAPGWGPAAVRIGELVFGTDWGRQNAELTAASPVTYIGTGAPPFLIVQGLADQLVPPAQSVELHDRLVHAGDAATLVLVAHAGHELGATLPITPSVAELAQQVASFAAAVR